MKKLLSAICTTILILMIPALFIGYLYNSGISDTTTQNNKAAKIETANANQEMSLKPGLMSILKGI